MVVPLCQSLVLQKLRLAFWIVCFVEIATLYCVDSVMKVKYDGRLPIMHSNIYYVMT